MNTPLWQPSETRVQSSRLHHFTSYLNTRFHTHFKDYATLYRWSVDNKADFWEAIWDYFEVINSHKGNTQIENESDMLNTRFFKNAKLNFAENLLKRRDEHTALISLKENGQRDTISFNELYLRVAQLASALKEGGVTKGARVAALMPNTANTIIAMLATTSLGAIWSSCSPDFGLQGVMDRFSQIEPTILFTIDGYHYNGKVIDISETVKHISDKISSIQHIVITPFLSDKPNTHDIDKVQLWDSFVDRTAKNIDFESCDFNDPLYIMYSSGTTGVPKCIVHGVGGTLLQHIKELGIHSNLGETDTLFYFSTCGWMMWNWFVSALALGSSLVLFDGSPSFPDMNRLLEILEREKVTAFGTSAKYIAALEKDGLTPAESHDLSALKTIFSTGSPLSDHSFDYVYQKIKKDLQLSSISGGTDIISCFALGNPTLPVYKGELQCIGLGMDVAVYNDAGKSVLDEKGELVCLSPFPCQPIGFWQDDSKQKYKAAYFSRFDNIWAHGDYAKITKNKGVVIYGRSDAVLNPGGVRIGTAEIYRQVEKVPQVIDSVVIGQPYQDDLRVILFVVLKPKTSLDETLLKTIKQTIRQNATPRHVPQLILAVPDIPRTISGKTAELAVKKAVMGEAITNLDALQNPESLDVFKTILNAL